MESVYIIDKQYDRFVSLFDENMNIILQVCVNLYYPDCFKWKILKERNWQAFVTGWLT